jgi:hypothetical protein
MNTNDTTSTSRTICELFCGRNMNDPLAVILRMTEDRKWFIASENNVQISTKQALEIVARDGEEAVKEAERYCFACGVYDPFERNA